MGKTFRNCAMGLGLVAGLVVVVEGASLAADGFMYVGDKATRVVSQLVKPDIPYQP